MICTTPIFQKVNHATDFFRWSCRWFGRERRSRCELQTSQANEDFLDTKCFSRKHDFQSTQRKVQTLSPIFSISIISIVDLHSVESAVLEHLDPPNQKRRQVLTTSWLQGRKPRDLTPEEKLRLVNLAALVPWRPAMTFLILLLEDSSLIWWPFSKKPNIKTVEPHSISHSPLRPCLSLSFRHALGIERFQRICVCLCISYTCAENKTYCTWI